ncbi:MAG: glycosyltransferase [Bacteroidales bacterium]|nr:glycosyltransferase [Bacteroidales bacterium]
MQTETHKNILIAPLDWGIGHAARCVPLINFLNKNNYNIFLASNGKSLTFLENEFPNLTCIKIEAYNISYAFTGKAMALKMLSQIPKILKTIYIEHKQLNRIIEAYKIDLIISDNRYGLWHKTVPSVFITHQLMIKMPWHLRFLEKLTNKVLKCFIQKFSVCWVPDFEDHPNLSGDLSHKYKVSSNTFFIGPLSRFLKTDIAIEDKNYDLLIMLSGPEPQRSILEKIILNQLKESNFRVAFLRGLPDSKASNVFPKNIEVFEHLSTQKIEELIKKSRLIIARSGYSTIMDLIRLNAKAVLIPTPGQTEQIYLAQFHHERGHFLTTSQEQFKLNRIIDEASKFPFVPFRTTKPHFKNSSYLSVDLLPMIETFMNNQ